MGARDQVTAWLGALVLHIVLETDVCTVRYHGTKHCPYPIDILMRHARSHEIYSDTAVR